MQQTLSTEQHKATANIQLPELTGDLEYIEIVVEPAAYINMAEHLLVKTILPYCSALRDHPFYVVTPGTLDKTLEIDHCREKVESETGIGILCQESDCISIALVREGRIAALANAYDCEHFHSYSAVQPSDVNDWLVEQMSGEVVIPTNFFGTVRGYNLKGHDISIERTRVSSIREANLGLEIETFLGYEGIR
jgi:hypothetical protein